MKYKKSTSLFDDCPGTTKADIAFIGVNKKADPGSSFEDTVPTNSLSINLLAQDKSAYQYYFFLPPLTTMLARCMAKYPRCSAQARYYIHHI
jgi:hypothetical protein